MSLAPQLLALYTGAVVACTVATTMLLLRGRWWAVRRRSVRREQTGHRAAVHRRRPDRAGKPAEPQHSGSTGGYAYGYVDDVGLSPRVSPRVDAGRIDAGEIDAGNGAGNQDTAVLWQQLSPAEVAAYVSASAEQVRAAQQAEYRARHDASLAAATAQYETLKQWVGAR